MQEGKLKINEIFKSIQGESTWQGLVFTFIRLTGCNLRCSYCDTKYAYEAGEEMSCKEILGHVEKLGASRIMVTGGEPLFQPGVDQVMGELLNRGNTVLLETNGSLDIGQSDPRVIKIVDIKCPGSGMNGRMLWSNLEKLGDEDEVKFILTDRGDYDWARRVIKDYGLEGKRKVLLTPAFGALSLSQLAGWMGEDGGGLRLGLQLHKYIWKPGTRGV